MTTGKSTQGSRTLSKRGPVRTNTRHWIALIVLILSPWPSSLLRAQSVWTDMGIHMDDDVVIDARIIKPLGFPPSGGFPGIVLVHGYGGSKETMRDIQIALATYGYASIAYSVRGQGNSGGVSTVDADRERQDLVQVIQFFRNTQGIHPDKIGVTGGSQGGIHAWMAAAYKMRGVKAVAPLIATPDFASTLVPDGCIRTALPRELRLSTVRYSEDRQRLEAFVVSDLYDSVLTFIAQRDLKDRVQDITVPVLQVLGWKDIIFSANGGIHAREMLAQKGIPIHSYFGTNGHGLPPDLFDAGATLEKLVQWFDHWLRGSSLPADSLPVVVYSDDRLSFDRQATVEWPPTGALNARYFLTARGLSTELNVGEHGSSFAFSLNYDSTYSPQQGWNDLYGGDAFLRAFRPTSKRFVSDRFDRTVEITGIPKGQVFVRSADSCYQVHVRFYDVDDLTADSSWVLFSRSIHGVRGSTPESITRLELEGTAISHTILIGHRLGIEITSLDMLDETQANTIPFFRSTEVEVLTSLEAPSYVQIGHPDSIVSEAPLHEPLPPNVMLEQNYPNPFNPTTEINFFIPAAHHARLVVCDILGREIAVLVDDFLVAGRHTVHFDGSAFSSGTYLLQLATPSGLQTRRMLLLR